MCFCYAALAWLPLAAIFIMWPVSMIPISIMLLALTASIAWHNVKHHGVTLWSGSMAAVTGMAAASFPLSAGITVALEALVLTPVGMSWAWGKITKSGRS